jgi:hypothetical protein
LAVDVAADVGFEESSESSESVEEVVEEAVADETVYVDPAKTVVIPLGARVMTGPTEVTIVNVDPSTAARRSSVTRHSKDRSEG